MNNLDKQYQHLLKDILEYGVDKQDRTGTGTKSIFGYMIHHNMRNGFPLLTTKKVPFKTMATELMWFLMGDTNIKYLVDNDCHIWDGDCYQNYCNNCKDEKYLNSLPLISLSKLESFIVDCVLYSQEEFINKIKTNDEFAREWGELGPIYGAQWRRWFPGGKDQIQNLINDLKTNPDSRRLIVSAWNVGELDQMVLPPCHYGFQVYTRELSFEERASRSYLYSKLPTQTDMPMLSSFVADILPTDENGWSNLFDEFNIPTRAISLSWNQRSVDVFLGLPFNIASYGLLLEMIAREVNMVPEHLIGHLGDTHLYSNHIEQAKEQISRTPLELPTLKISSGHNFRAAMAGKADEIDLNDFILLGYEPHPTIKAPLSN
jgi:thymidylate synthase